MYVKTGCQSLLSGQPKMFADANLNCALKLAGAGFEIMKNGGIIL